MIIGNEDTKPKQPIEPVPVVFGPEVLSLQEAQAVANLAATLARPQIEAFAQMLDGLIMSGDVRDTAVAKLADQLYQRGINEIVRTIRRQP